MKNMCFFSVKMTTFARTVCDLEQNNARHSAWVESTEVAWSTQQMSHA